MGRVTLFWACMGWLVAASSARADERVFALVVASNRGTSMAQPALAYADDDGVRFFQLFRAAAAADGDVALLTRLDTATRAAYPELEPLATPPTRDALASAISNLAAKVSAARARGERTLLYFVFAGHGEVRDGRGWLGLEDSAIDGEFIERELIERIPADVKHVLLDSCNSFFVINPRKPGGRRWATPDDMAFGFSARHPEVGVFLSTNAEEEVFEWSRLESGVFSHEVRSGLRGGADVDRDGQISYAELAGFVTRANQGIVRESLRPHLFFRGPQGERGASLFSLAALRGARLSLDPAQTRAWVVDARGERVLDLHKEAGALSVVLPSAQGELTLYAQHPTAGAATQRFALRDQAGALAAEQAPAELVARGSQIFGELFSAPYGSQAFAAFEREERANPPDVFGLSRSDTARADYFVHEIALASRDTRKRQGFVSLTMGLTFLGTAAATLGLRWDERPVVAASVFGGLGLGFGALGTYLLSTDSGGERAYAALHTGLSSDGRAQREAFLRSHDELSRLERSMRRQRRASAILLLIPGTIYAVGGVFVLAHPDTREDYATLGAIMAGEGALLSGAGIIRALVPTVEERLIRLYRRDPQLSLQLAPNVTSHGAGLSLGGKF